MLVDELGANIHSKLVNGSEPVHLAAQEGYDMCFRAMLERGADVNVTNFNGRTPLHAAAESGRDKVIPTLIRHGATMDLRDTKASMIALDLAEMALIEWHSSNFRFGRKEVEFREVVRMLRDATNQDASILNNADLFESKQE